MNQTEMVRRLDDIGRVVIPKEIRDSFRLNSGGDLRVGIEGNRIVLTPVKNALFDRYFGEILAQKYGYSFGIYSKESRVQGFAAPVEVPEPWTHYSLGENNRKFQHDTYHVYPVVSNTTRCYEGYIVIPAWNDDYSYTVAIVDVLSRLV